MLVRPRVMILSTACCLLAVMAAPGAALAHGGAGRDGHGYGRPESRAQRLCAEAGVPLNGHVYGEGHGLSGLSETQVKELKAACEKLATAYAAQRKADEAASKALWEAFKSDRTKLNEACPALSEHHEPGSGGPTELSAACKEALKSYGVAVHEAQQSYRKAIEEAGKTFATALSEFEKAVKPIEESLQTATPEDHHHGQAPSGAGWPGAWQPGGAGPAGLPGGGQRGFGDGD